jgi:BirA family biotin operon repressor/biotin-[acetyl-CoA-carboxylase] ligase
MLAADRLSAAKLRAGLGQCTIGKEIIVLDETTSTNDVVLQLANGGAPEGLVVFTEHQTAGRGQRNNVWESAAGKGLLFSLLLRPNIAMQESARLVDWAVKGIAWAVESACLRKATIKPPNDIYIDGRKVGGVLVEMRAQPGAPHLAVVGVGVNVNQTLQDFSEEIRQRATSLAIARHGPIDRSVFALALLRNLDLLYRAGSL